MNSLARKEPVMMRGTGGAMDYHVFAHKGRMGLGFKMLGMSPGAMSGVPDSVHYAIRLRAAKLPEAVYAELSNASSVVSFANPDGNPHEAFPQISFDKRAPARASAIIAGFFKPDFSLNEEKKLVGADDIQNGAARQQFLDYMKKALDDQGVVQVMTDDEVLETMQSFEQMILKKVWETLLTQDMSSEVKAESTGVVGSQQDLAVKIKKKMEAIDPTLAAAADSMPTPKSAPPEQEDFPDPDAESMQDIEDDDPDGEDDEEGLDDEDEDK